MRVGTARRVAAGTTVASVAFIVGGLALTASQADATWSRTGPELNSGLRAAEPEAEVPTGAFP